MNCAELKILESLQDEAKKKREEEIREKEAALKASIDLSNISEPTLEDIANKISSLGENDLFDDDNFRMIFDLESQIDRQRATALYREKAKSFKKAKSFDELLKAYRVKEQEAEKQRQALEQQKIKPHVNLPFIVPKNKSQPDGEKKVVASLLAMYMKRRFTLKVYNGQFRILKNNYYQYVENIKQLISSQIPEVYRVPRNIEDCEKLLIYDKCLTLKDEDLAPENYIAFKNGVLDVMSMEFIDYSNPKTKHLIFIHQVAYNWNPMIKNDPKTDDFFHSITNGNQEDIDFLFQILGVLISNYRDFKNILYFVGVKDTGKSQFLHICELLLTNPDDGRDFSSIGLRALTDENSKELIGIIGKRANICAETPPLNIKNDTLLKQLSGGDFVTLFQKFLGGITFKNKAMLIFAGNTVPNFFVNDKSSIGERLLIYKFKTAIPKEKQIPNVFKTLNMEYVIVKAVDQLLKFIENKQHFTIPEEIYANRELMERESDSIYRFYKDCVVYTENKEHRINSHDLFTAYQYFLMDEGSIPKDPYANQPDIRHIKLSQRAFIGKIKPMIGERYHSRSVLYYDGKVDNCFTGIQLQGVHIDWNDQEYKIKLLK
ncbi:DNA primase family protein [Acetobacterium wieringae]|uniref:DNA primase family protein n=1 Tax=Acetobacterium wieringae TaxID=52694 RepID=UPI00315809D9